MPIDKGGPAGYVIYHKKKQKYWNRNECRFGPVEEATVYKHDPGTLPWRETEINTAWYYDQERLFDNTHLREDQNV